jgi:hypothetical protein
LFSSACGGGGDAEPKFQAVHGQLVGEPTTTTMATTTTSEAPTTTTTAAPKAWVVAGQLTGATTKAGTPFALTGGQQRLKGSCTRGCNIYIKSVSTGITECDLLFSEEGSPADETACYMPSGDHYIDVFTYGKFDVTLEELR